MKRLWKWLPVIVWAAIILSAANDTFSDEHTAGWLERLLGTPVPYALNAAVRKTGHVVAYAFLALLAWRAERKFALAVAVALLVSIVDESKQAMTLTRQGSPFDVILDTCGALLAVAVVERWVRSRRASP